MADPTRRNSNLGAALVAGGLLAAGAALAQPAALHVHRLNPDGQSFSDVRTAGFDRPRFSPDGHWIAFWYDGETDEVPDLYVADRFTAQATRVSISRPAGALDSDQLDLEFTADSRYLLFRIDQETVARQELWSVAVDGEAADAVKLSGALEPGEAVTGFQPSLDGAHAIFWTDAPAEIRVWSVPVDGSAAAVRIDPAGAADNVVDVGMFGDQYYFRDTSSGKLELYRAPVDGSAGATRINGDLVAGASVGIVELTADRTRVVYTADARFPGTYELWSVPAAGPTSAAVRLSPTLPAGGEVFRLQLESNPPRALFLADTAISGQGELWSAPLTGPAEAAVHLNVALVAGGEIDGIATLAGRVIYTADNAVVGRYQAWIVPIDGPFTASVRLHGDLASGQSVSGAGFIPGSPSPRGLLIGNLRDVGKLELFLQDVDDPAEPYPLFGDLPDGSGYDPSCLAAGAPDLSWFAICAARGIPDKVQLFRVDNEFGATPERLSNVFTADGSNVIRVVGSPDGEWVAFVADEGADGRFDLYRARTDGTGSAARVHAAPASTLLDVVEDTVKFPSDSAGILYAADHRINGHMDAWISDGMIFGDGFELGTPAHWSDTSP